MNHTEIIAVVVCYNGSYDILQTIKALQNKVAHIHIVDNNSSFKTLEVLNQLEQESNISVTYLIENKGIGYALNVGVNKGLELGFNWLLTMDQDSFIDSKMVEEFCKAINFNNNLICLTPSISVFGTVNSFNCIKKKDNLVDYAITSGNLVKLSVFKTVGLYNEELFIDCVDFDFSLRVRKSGYNINIVPEAILYHQLGEKHNVPKIFSWFYTSHSTLRRYYMYRNWGYMIEQYSFKFPLFILKSSIIHILLLLVIPFYDKKPKESLKFIYYGVRDYFKKQYGPLKI